MFVSGNDIEYFTELCIKMTIDNFFFIDCWKSNKSFATRDRREIYSRFECFMKYRLKCSFKSFPARRLRYIKTYLSLFNFCKHIFNWFLISSSFLSTRHLPFMNHTVLPVFSIIEHRTAIWNVISSWLCFFLCCFQFQSRFAILLKWINGFSIFSVQFYCSWSLLRSLAKLLRFMGRNRFSVIKVDCM